MTWSEYVALILSLLAFVLSILSFVFNAYQQYVKAAKLRLVLGRELKYGFLDGSKQLGFWVPVALSNQGAVDAIVLKIEGGLAGPDARLAKLDWYTVGEYDGTDGTFTPKGWTDTLIVSSRKATSAWIGFRSSSEEMETVEAGDYTLTLSVDAPVGSSGRKQGAATWTGTLSLATDDIKNVPKVAATPATLALNHAQTLTLTGSSAQNATATLLGLKGLEV